MSLVRLEHLTKIYPGGVKAVDDVSLSITDQEFVVLVGPSGCGKSTTLRLIAGLEHPDGGTIQIGDRVVNAVPPKDRDIAMVFQNYALYPHMTVYGNLSFALRLRKMPNVFARLWRPGRAREIRDDIRARVHRVADLLAIKPLLDRKPRELSGGQRQRVALGRAIVREPSAFLFDEPLSNLDARLRITTRAELKRLHQRLRTTTIYVTHDQEEAMTLGDRIVVMKDGKIQQADAPLHTYHYPINRFVGGFIGMPPMNFFEGTLVAAGDGLAFVEGHSRSPLAGRESGSELTLSPKGFTLALSSLSPAVRERLRCRLSAEVVLGIRPEHLSLQPIRSESGETVSVPLEMRVMLVEPLGNDLDLYLKSALHENVVARVEAPVGNHLSQLRVDSAVKVHADLRRVHLFEPGETGLNLSLETLSSGQPCGESNHALA